MALSDEKLIDVVAAATSVTNAKTIVVNSGVDLGQYDEFLTNKIGFDEFMAGKKKAVDDVVVSIVANTEYTAEMLAGKPMDELNILNALATKKDAVRIAEGVELQLNKADTSVDYT
jgi:hypothetical protein